LSASLDSVSRHFAPVVPRPPPRKKSLDQAKRKAAPIERPFWSFCPERHTPAFCSIYEVRGRRPASANATIPAIPACSSKRPPRLPGFSSNCFRKIEARAKVRPAMTPQFDNSRATRRRTPPGLRIGIKHHHYAVNLGSRGKRKNGVGGRRNPLKRLDSDKGMQENQRVFL
jgi:hypothetical protein